MATTDLKLDDPGSLPKPGPIGIPAFEDQVLQRAEAMVLEAVYEEDCRIK